MVKSGIIGVLVFLVVFVRIVHLDGRSDKDSEPKGEKQERKLKQEKICLLVLGEVDTTLLEKLSTGLEKIFGKKVKVSQIPLNLEFAYNPERK
jgi:hypothetical protein